MIIDLTQHTTSVNTSLSANPTGRPALPQEAQDKRGTWRSQKKKKDSKPKKKKVTLVEAPVVDKRTFPDAKLKAIMQTGIPGYDPWRDCGDCYVDYEAARDIIRFFHCKLRHYKGGKGKEKFAGKPFILSEWQIAIVANLCGWKQPDDIRRYREAFIMVGRKNGKSPLVAGLLLYFLSDDGEEGAEVYGAAKKYSQAELVFKYARGMMLQDWDIWEDNFRIYNGAAKSIQRMDDYSTYNVISHEGYSAHGYNTHCWVIDELHAQPNRDLLDALRTSTMARSQPMGIMITTSDYNRESICNTIYNYACKVRDGHSESNDFLPVIFEASKSDDWKDPKTWAKANPNMGISFLESTLAKECQRAQDEAGGENVFKRFNLNIRTDSEVAFIESDKWDACKTSFTEADLHKKECYGGLDLASTGDITCLVLLFPEGSTVKVLPFYWVPKKTAAARDKRDRTSYQKWIDQGIVRCTPGDIIDYAFVRRDINILAKEYRIKKINVDIAFQGLGLACELDQDGIEIGAFSQVFSSYAAPTQELDRLIRSKQLQHNGCPVLSWMASNVMIKINAEGHIKPDKQKSSDKIDGISSTIMGLSLVMAHREKQSVYSSRGVIAF